MAIFNKNPNYNPNDANSNRYLQVANSTPEMINKPVSPAPSAPLGSSTQYTQGKLSLLKLANPLFTNPYQTTPPAPTPTTPEPVAPTPENVPRGTITPPAPITPPTPTPAPVAAGKSFYREGGSLYDSQTNAKILSPEALKAGGYTKEVPKISPITPPAGGGITPAAGKTFYREGGSLYDSQTGQKILSPEAMKAGGYTIEVSKGGGPTAETKEKASDLEIQNILKMAGEAGLSASEAMTMVDNYNNLTKEERDKIKTDLGISDVVTEAYKTADQTTVDYYNKAYAASELPTLKQTISKLDETIAQRRADLAKAVEDLQNNPWLSQASRTGRLGILNDKANADIANLTTQRQQYLDQYDKGVTAIESEVTKYKDQLESDRTINVEKLNYLLGEAEKQATTAASEKKTANLKYLPEYLKAKTAKEKEKNAYELEKARLENLKLMQETGQTGEFTNVEGSYSNLSQGVVGGYDISSYATDPNHEKAVQGILNGIGKFNSIPEMDAYIKRKYPNSPVTGQMIANAATKYGVSWEMMTAMMEQDSSMGTAGKGARTFNPGNVGNDDSGNIRNYGNWQAGVDAVANWLSRHKSTAVGPSGEGYTGDQMTIAQSIMAPGSTLTVDKISQKDRPGVEAALNKLREDATSSGDIYGVMKASAGGAKMDSTTVQNLARFGTALTQLSDLKKDLDSLKAKGGTGAFKGLITDKKFWKGDVATIKAKLQGAIPTIARGVFGEVGVLTDADIENYKKTIPNIKTPTAAVDTIYKGLLSTIDSKILSTYEAYANAGYDVSGFANTYRNMKQTIIAQSTPGIKIRNPQTGEIRSGAGLDAYDIAEARKQGYEIIQ